MLILCYFLSFDKNDVKKIDVLYLLQYYVMFDQVELIFFHFFFFAVSNMSERKEYQKYKCVACSRYDRKHIFKVPPEPHRRQAWLTALSLGPECKDSWRVCSRHFTEHDWTQKLPRSVRRLKPTAIPSVYLPHPPSPPPSVPLDATRTQDILSNKELTMPACQCLVQNRRGGKNRLYDQLVFGQSVEDVRQKMAARGSLDPELVRVIEAQWHETPGFKDTDCVRVSETISRGSEKLLVIVKRQPNHSCDHSLLGLAIVLFDAIPKNTAKFLYEDIRDTAGSFAPHMERGCLTARVPKKRKAEDGSELVPEPEPPKCGCSLGGLSATFGCSWSEWTKGSCKFRDHTPGEAPRRFELTDRNLEGELEKTLNSVANFNGAVLAKLCPDAYSNMCVRASPTSRSDCRIGTGEHRPFSNATTVMDVSTHSHQDTRNNLNGATCVLTLLRDNNEADRQLHVLPHYSVTEPTGGLGMDLESGSLLIEYARVEKHSTSRVENPSREKPKRIGVVCVQHKQLYAPDHGR